MLVASRPNATPASPTLKAPRTRLSIPPLDAAASGSSSQTAPQPLAAPAPASAAAAATAAPDAAASAAAFARFRPTSHFLAPRGWMNDPSGPSWDPVAQRHQLFYEWNPRGSTWGHMSWGRAHAPSLAGPWTHDNLHDEQGKDQPVLEPKAPWDCEGIFTGCVVTHGPAGEAHLQTAIYTAVSALPIHFSRAYNRGCEKLALATSADGGKTWERSSTLVLPGPPDGIDVLSWRDPYVAPWPEMDALFGTAPDTHYHGMIAGSVPGVGPRLFLYRIPRTQLGSWTFLGTLGEFGFNESLPGAPWSGELGRNWEVGMFFTLRAASGRSTQYVLLNVEGCLLDEPARHPMWLACSFDADAAGKARMLPQASALLDDGCGYASSSFLDPTTGRRMMWTWVTEDDLPEAHYEPQGWSGCMSLPRELFQLDIPHVTGALHTPLKDIGSFSLETQSDGTALVSTLGIRLGDEVVRLREGAARRCNAETHVLSDASLRLPVASRSWELCATVKVDDATKSVGIVFAHNDSLSQRSSIAFHPAQERLIVDRTHSTKFDAGIKTTPISSPLTLLRTRAAAGAPEEQELLRLRVVCDNSVVEVFANDRLALATRIYPDDAASVGLSLFAEGKAAFETLDVWEGLAGAFEAPRPANPAAKAARHHL